jgi:chaperone modulatory protein CbpM
MRIQDVLAAENLIQEQHELEDFIARGWVKPVRDEKDYIFDDMDIARIKLVCELHIEMKLELDAVDIILSLMDQLYESRTYVDKIVNAIKQQPKEAQNQILECFVRE